MRSGRAKPYLLPAAATRRKRAMLPFKLVADDSGGLISVCEFTCRGWSSGPVLHRHDAVDTYVPMPPLLDALGALDADIYTVIEQDLYPVEPDIPLPIGARTAGYYVACGLGPVRRWRTDRARIRFSADQIVRCRRSHTAVPAPA